MIEKNNNIIRCAIYTRKSSDEGLDKEFNTLEAQRESGEDYIKSQKHLGWQVIPTLYDDGGFSGGNINRPAFKRLMEDVDAGLVDMIVVYKIDRLTRSLTDFSKIVEILDNNRCSFVSVTQHFNTADSMGRLTLNMLLSFAQFEREVSSERIRDKVAASKKKGMWMGGTVPYGYNNIDKKLIIEPNEAFVVETIFDTYLKYGSILKIIHLLEAQNILPRLYFKKKNTEPNESFLRAQIIKILKNPIYMGKVSYKNELYAGQHEAIISEDIFNQAQKIRSSNNKKVTKKAPPKPALLKGLLECGCCNAKMVSTHSKKKERIYEYYTSIRAVKEGYDKCGLGPIPAGELDAFIIKEIIKIFEFPMIAQAMVKKAQEKNPNYDESNLYNAVQNMEDIFKIMDYQSKREIVDHLINKIIVNSNSITIEFKEDAVAFLSIQEKAKLKNSQITYNICFTSKYGHTQIVLSKGESYNALQDNPLYEALLRAFAWNNQINENGKSLTQLSVEEKMSKGYIAKVIRMTNLAPCIIDAILSGTAPKKLKLEHIIERKIPLLWVDQKLLYGFA